MKTVFILDYQMQADLVGPVHVGDQVSWTADTQVGDFYGDVDLLLREAWYFETDEARAEDDDEPAGTVIAGEVTQVLAVWCQHDRTGLESTPVPGTVRTASRPDANRSQRNDASADGADFVGYLISIE